MIVYRDLISGDEVLSDAFKLSQVIDSDGVAVSYINIKYFVFVWFLSN